MFYMHHTAGWGWGWWVLMTLGIIAFWAVVVYGILWVVRGGRLPNGEEPPAVEESAARRPPAEPPEQILKRRLAAGEISLEDYERTLEVIHDGASRPTAAAGQHSGG